MKLLLLGTLLSVSLTTFARPDQGKYLLVGAYCNGTSLTEKTQEAIKEANKNYHTIMNIIDNEVKVSSIDDCGANVATYSLSNNAQATRMNYQDEVNVKFPNTCPNTMQQSENGDLIIQNQTENTLEVSVDGLGVSEICDGELVFIYNKVF